MSCHVGGEGQSGGGAVPSTSLPSVSLARTFACASSSLPRAVPSGSAPPPSHQRVARWACAFASHLALGRRVAVSSLTRVLPPTAHAAYRLAPSRACAWASRTVPPLAMPASPVPSAAATTGERAASAAVTRRRSEGVSEGVGRTRSWPLALVSGPVAWRRNRQVPAHSPACRRIVG